MQMREKEQLSQEQPELGESSDFTAEGRRFVRLRTKQDSEGEDEIKKEAPPELSPDLKRE